MFRDSQNVACERNFPDLAAFSGFVQTKDPRPKTYSPYESTVN